MEVNTRLQVEHPVTEATTGLDLVKLQLHVAVGGGWTASRRRCTDTPWRPGCAPRTPSRASCRPRAGSPCCGCPTGSGVRVDSGLREGDLIPPEFDSMIAKIVAWGRDRDEALARLRRALAQSTVVVEGGTTNRSFLLALLDRPEIRDGRLRQPLAGPAHRGRRARPGAGPGGAAGRRGRGVRRRPRGREAAFHAGARRGRPEMPDDRRRPVRLRYAGRGL